jgi:hypothetical protein
MRETSLLSIPKIFGTTSYWFQDGEGDDDDSKMVVVVVGAMAQGREEDTQLAATSHATLLRLLAFQSRRPKERDGKRSGGGVLTKMGGADVEDSREGVTTVESQMRHSECRGKEKDVDGEKKGVILGNK